VFLLHIQGSGQIELPGGTRTAVGFAGRNGQPYGSIGTVLIKNGALKPAETNIGTIRAWLNRNPQKRQEILNANASYIFFKEQNHLDPIGAMGVALTPRRSLAVDPSFIPYGAPLWVDIPGNERLPGGLQSLLIAQDTGAAIKGAVRGDVFWGHDAVAEERAGTMNNPGSYYLLLPRQQLVANAL
jgi:membrane-bound lytic murein transglycosylase A